MLRAEILELALINSGLSVAPLSNTESRANRAAQLIQQDAAVHSVERFCIPT